MLDLYNPEIKPGESIAAFCDRLREDYESLGPPEEQNEEGGDDFCRQMLEAALPPFAAGVIWNERPLQDVIPRLQRLFNREQ